MVIFTPSEYLPKNITFFELESVSALPNLGSGRTDDARKTARIAPNVQFREIGETRAELTHLYEDFMKKECIQ
jgi:hypothetical protein